MKNLKLKKHIKRNESETKLWQAHVDFALWQKADTLRRKQKNKVKWTELAEAMLKSFIAEFEPRK